MIALLVAVGVGVPTSGAAGVDDSGSAASNEIVEVIEEITGGEADVLNESVSPHPAVNISPAVDGVETLVVETDSRTSVVAILDEGASDSVVSFPVEVDRGHELVVLPHGGGVVVDISEVHALGFDLEGVPLILDRPGVVVATLHEPWAVDAEGAQLPTEYELVGDVLVQHVDTSDAVFPVAADPSFSLGWKGLNPLLYIHFNKYETSSFATYSGSRLKSAAGVFCEFAPRGTGWLCTQLIKARVNDLSATAKAAERQGRCLSGYNSLGVTGIYEWGTYHRKC